MKKLNDVEIRESLIQYLLSKSITADQIIEELHVCNGRAIADVVTLKGEPHCYEIKGDNDRLERFLLQNEFYKRSFRKMTLVTTTKYLDKAVKLAPAYWGILVIKFNKHGEIVVRQVRSSKVNVDFDKTEAILTLWKSEILELLPSVDKKLEKSSRATLANIIADTKESLELSKEIGKILFNRTNSINRF